MPAVGPDETVRKAEREAGLDPALVDQARAEAARYVDALARARALLREGLPVLARECSWCEGRCPRTASRLPAGQERALCPRCMEHPGWCACCRNCKAWGGGLANLVGRVREELR